MKALRQAKIKELVETQSVETQEDLMSLLRESNIDVTQATVSRDIREMMLFKATNGEGRYCYALPSEESVILSRTRIANIFHDSINGMDYSQNLCVIHTLPGLAQAVASIIDTSKWEEVVGTIAGDDTVLVIVRSGEEVQEFMSRVNAIIES